MVKHTKISNRKSQISNALRLKNHSWLSFHFPFKKNPTHKQAGFTLLELMVVITMSAVMAGGGLFAFTQYSRSQAFNQGIEQLKLAYDQARNNAISNVKPDVCNTTSVLRGYRVTLESDSISLITHCTIAGADITTSNMVKSQKLPPGVKLRNWGNCSGVEYQVITGNVAYRGTDSLPCPLEIYHEADPDLDHTIEIGADGRLVL
ncbi:MAG TPA: type II secretion system protein [Candidatus Levybacteria bacterium]|nr:type II secretion system protein [Candidatus Levybacteria bacterium]